MGLAVDPEEFAEVTIYFSGNDGVRALLKAPPIINFFYA